MVVNGYTKTMVVVMEPDSTIHELNPKRAKQDMKREKNRESSARSRKRKKDDDERNGQEILRLENENERLQKTIENLIREGQEQLSKVDPYFLDNPECSGCVQRDNINSGAADNSTHHSEQLHHSPPDDVSFTAQVEGPHRSL